MSKPKAHLSIHDARFQIEPFVSPRGLGTTFFVRDADWITDAEVRAKLRPPTVGCFDTDAEAEEFCRRVIDGEIANTIPHESNFVGWPALKARVQAANL